MRRTSARTLAAMLTSAMSAMSLALTGRGLQLFALLTALTVLGWSCWQDQRQEH